MRVYSLRMHKVDHIGLEAWHCYSNGQTKSALMVILVRITSASTVKYRIEITASLAVPGQLPGGVSTVQGLGAGRDGPTKER